MKRIAVWSILTASAITLAGCGFFRTDTQDAPPNGTLGAFEYSLADLLTKPRADLARQSKELEDKIDKQLDGFHQNQLEFTLLPTTRVSRGAPVFREAVFHDRLGFSLPSYAQAPDNSVALHLAQYGDLEAARKMTTDPSTLEQISECELDRNYSVEWTRLIGLLQTEARIRLATHDVTGATDIAQIHKQLRELLGEKAARSPLGASLLGGGRTTLAEAAVAWHAGKNEERAHEADEALASWGEVPGWTWPLPANLTGAELAKLLHGTERGHIVIPDKPARLLDVCDLPLPRDGIDNAFLCLDSTGHFREAVVIYQPSTTRLYQSRISNLAVHLEEQGLAPQAGEEKWIRRSTYETSLGDAEFVLPLTGEYLGAVVRFRNHEARQDVSLTRDFSLVHLDRSFENNRWRLDPKVMTEPFKTEDADQLNGLANPLRSWKPHAASLAREQQYDMVAKFGISYEMDVTKPPFSRVVEEAWETWGPARIEEEHGDVPTLNFSWQDTDTCFTVRFPLDSIQMTEFVANDRSNLDPAQRAAHVADWNRQERLTHLQLGHTSHRVPRKLEFEGVELGMKMNKAIDLFNRASHFNVRKLADGAMATFDGPAPEKFPCVARQVFLRGDANRCLAEIRVRYQDTGDGSSTAEWCAALLGAWKAKCGAPVTVTPTWTGVWPEYQSAKPIMLRWADEQSMLTFQYDDKGVEMVLRNCPVDQPEGVSLPPLKYLPRGPEGYELGSSQIGLLDDAPISQKSVSEDMVVIEPKSPSPYDQIQIWFDHQHKLARVVARHAGKDNHAPTQDEQTDLLRDFWARSLKSLGWTRRQDMSAHKAVDSLGWQDDCTRLRTYWAKSSGQFRLFTEWKDLGAEK